MLALISVSGTALFHNRRLCASLSSGSPRQRLPKVSERENRHHERSPPKKEKGTKSVGGSRAFQLSPVIYSKVLSASVAEQPACTFTDRHIWRSEADTYPAMMRFSCQSAPKSLLISGDLYFLWALSFVP